MHIGKWGIGAAALLSLSMGVASTAGAAVQPKTTTTTTATTPPSTSGATVSAAAGANGDQYDFWMGSGPGHNLWEAFYNGTAWSGPIKLGFGPLGSTPTAAVGSNGDQYVYWMGSGPGHNLWEAYYNGSAWVGPIKLGFGPLGSQPSVAVWTATIPATTSAAGSTPASTYDQQDVFWQGSGSGHNLWEAYWNGSAWVGPVKLGFGPLGSAPTAGASNSGTTAGQQYVFWEGSGAGHNLWEGYWNGSAWVGPQKIGFGPLGSQPSVAVWLATTTVAATATTPASTTFYPQQDVFWQGSASGHNLWEGYWNGTMWVGPQKIGFGPLGSAPSAAVWLATIPATSTAPAMTYGQQDVFWSGSATGKNLWEGYWNDSSWSGPQKIGFGPIG